MNILILSRKDILNWKPIDKTAIISITSIDNEFVDIMQNNLVIAVKQIKFNDVEWNEPNAITELQANEIASFIKENISKVDTFICQCDAGISRSAGIAKAICEYYNIEFPYQNIFDENLHGIIPKFIPNFTVYRRILKYLQENK